MKAITISLMQVSELKPSEILQDEIKEYQLITKGTLEPFILRCADKLDKYGNFEDKTKISSELSKLFPAQRRMIQSVLPQKFKRDYTKPEIEEIPKTSLEELLELWSENFKTLHEVTKDISKKAFSGKYENLDKETEKFLTQEKSISELIEDAKSLNAELAIIKSKEDIREKIHPFQSLSLRALLFVKSLHEVANNVDQSAKWMKIGVEPNSEELIKTLTTKDELSRCVSCDWDSADFFNENLERVNRGLPIKLPSIENLKKGFEDSKVIEKVSKNLDLSKEFVIDILANYFEETKNKLGKKFLD